MHASPISSTCRVLAVCLALSLSTLAAQQNEAQKLTASDGMAGDGFGRSVAVFGDTAIVGAWDSADQGFQSGSAYVFTRTAGVWSEQQKLLASDGGPSHRFGATVAMYGDTAVIGAVSDTSRGANSGSAYVFVCVGGVWMQQQKLLASDASGGDKFGVSVSLFADTAVIGAFHDDDSGVDSGSVYVFVRNNGMWTQEQKLLASNGAAGDEFGGHVSVFEDTVAVGASTADGSHPDTGSAYVFVRNAGVWSEQQALEADDAVFLDLFGAGIALFGDTLLVGAWGDDDQGTDSGSVYAFVRAGGVWTQQQKILPGNGSEGARFGTAISISGEFAVMGASRHNRQAAGSGTAYVFVREAGQWQELVELLPSDGAAGDWFAAAVALSNGTAFAGTANDDDLGMNSGSTYVFDVLTVPPKGPRDLTLLDADGDGDLDGVTADGGYDSLRLWRNNGGGKLVRSDVALDPADRNPLGVGAGDLDDDGQVDDLVVACADSDTLTRVLDAGGAPVVMSGPSNGRRPVAVACGDLDPDGRDDVVVARDGMPLGEGAGIEVSLNGGAFTDLLIPAGTPNKVVEVALRDLDGDGDTDLAAIAHGTPDQILLFDGDGTGALDFAGALALPSSRLAAGLCCYDLDGSGRPDLAATSSVLFPANATIRVYTYTGSGALDPTDYSAGADLPVSGPSAVDMACGELDGDTFPGFVWRRDLVVVHRGGAQALYGYDAAASTVSSTGSIRTGRVAKAVAIGDLNGDCVDDIVIANLASNNIAVTLGVVGAVSQDFGTGCPGTGGAVPTLTGIGQPVLGNGGYGVQLSQALPSAPVLTLIAGTQTTTPLPGNCTLYLLPVIMLNRMSDSLGGDSLVFGIVNDPVFLCQDLYIQDVVLDAGGAFGSTLAISNAVRAHIGY